MKKYLASLAVIFLTLGVISVSAQDDYGQYSPQAGPPSPPPGQQDNQQPDQSGAAPGVARVSFIKGDVSSQRGDNGDWVAATVNTPISVGDRVSTGQNSRAELQLDSADVLRLADNATAKVAGISRENIQVQVGQGLVTYSIVRASEANSEIDTPNAAIHPDGPGEYRILVNPNGETELVVRSGSADVTEPTGSTHVDAGQMITVQGTDNPQYKTSAAPASDEWDSWNNDRDRSISSAQSWRKTDRYYTGSEDLDNYGVWSEVPDYGQVWTPAEGPGWVPYSSGRWVWEPYYGWTWVSYEPWGWAPYHYGRWFVYGGNWVWWPGPVVGYPGYYPIWSPAYVSFFGWGGVGFGFGFGFGWGFGHVGWLPCGPGDWFHPWWGGWGAHFNTFNAANNFHNGFGPLGPRGEHSFSNVNEAFRNDRVRAGLVSMDSNRFGRDAVSGHGQTMSAASFRQASMVSGKMPISPSKESFSPSGRAANPASFRGAPSSSQHFFSAAGRTNTASNSFASRSSANTSNTVRGQSGFGGNTSRNANTGPVTSNRPGWHTFTPPQSGAANHSAQGFAADNRAGASAGAQAENRSGWEHSTPSSRGNQAQPQEFNRGFSQPGQSQRSYTPQSASRGGYSNSYSRPTLNMRQPIVTPRGGSFGRAPSGGYSAPHGSYSQPRGAYTAPRGGGSGGGGRSAGGGGHPSGGHSSGKHR
ncbi:MAG: DUF6600 domain-containing protein [Candidatus Acidiferrales bacterium]|jgi:hypothetical protein